MNPWTGDCLPPLNWHFPVTVPPLSFPPSKEKTAVQCKERGISSCDCNRFYSQPDCDIGWDSSRGRFYHKYDLYMLTAYDSENDLPVFLLLQPVSRHDSHRFFTASSPWRLFLPDNKISKLFLDPAHDAIPIYEYCRRLGIPPFIALNEKRGVRLKYKNDFAIGPDSDLSVRSVLKCAMVAWNFPSVVPNSADWFCWHSQNLLPTHTTEVHILYAYARLNAIIYNKQNRAAL